MQNKHESELILGSRNGDMNAMAELFQRHYSASVGLARRIVPTREDSLDAVQSAYLSAFRNFGRFRGEASFKTWVTRIVVNESLTIVRRRARHRQCVGLDHGGPDGIRMQIVDRGPSPEDLACRDQASRSVLALVEKLPERLRDVFMLCEMSGLSLREAADSLGLTVQATKTRLFRARLRLRSQIASGRWTAQRAVTGVQSVGKLAA